MNTSIKIKVCKLVDGGSPFLFEMIIIQLLGVFGQGFTPYVSRIEGTFFPLKYLLCVRRVWPVLRQLIIVSMCQDEHIRDQWSENLNKKRHT